MFYMLEIIASQKSDDSESELGTITEPVIRPKKPSMYQVVLLNDDYTPMEFVVEVLVTIFGLNKNNATKQRNTTVPVVKTITFKFLYSLTFNIHS